MLAAGIRLQRYGFVAILLALSLVAAIQIGCGSSNTNKSSGTGGSGGGTGTGTTATSQQFLYVANGGMNTSGYVLNGDGSLTAISGSPFAVGGGNLAADSSGKFLFSEGGTSLSNEAINTDTIGSNGALTMSSTLTDSTLDGGIFANPNGATLYADSISAAVENPGWKIYSIGANGNLTFNTGVVNQIAGKLSFVSDGSFAFEAYCYHLDAEINQYSTANGTLTPVGNHITQVIGMTECPNTVAVQASGGMVAAA